MRIRPASDDDFDAITAITNHYIATTWIHFGYEPLAVDEVRSADRVRYPWFVAEADGVVVGYTKSGPWRGRAGYAWTTEIGLYIAPDARRQGLGVALYTTLLDELVRRGFRSAVAAIALPNQPSQALHRRFGFTQVGVFEDAGWKLDGWHAVEFWQKRFATTPEGPL